MAWTIYFGLRFWVRNFQIQYFWGFQKNEYIWGMKKLLIFWLGHYIIGLIWGGGGSFYIFLWLFLKAGYFLGVTKFQTLFWECLIFSLVDAWSKPTYTEKMRVPPPPPWTETTHGRNDSRPKRPTKIGRIDSPQNLAETTQAESTRLKRPGFSVYYKCSYSYHKSYGFI